MLAKKMLLGMSNEEDLAIEKNKLFAIFACKGGCRVTALCISNGIETPSMTIYLQPKAAQVRPVSLASECI